MKNLLITIFLLINFETKSQPRLTLTEKEIKSEYPDRKYESGVTNDGRKYISYETKDFGWTYYFDNTGRCNSNMLVPMYKDGHNAFIKKFNEKYIIVSDNHWKIYKEGQVIDVYLLYNKIRGLYYFMYE